MKTLFAAALVGSVGIASAAEFTVGAHKFTVPDGFTIELVASSPLVDRPIEADFDELGRLYVTDSSGSNDKPDKQLIDKPHRIVRLEDSDGDGKFDKTITFADKMMFPEGAMWMDGSLYVSAPPSIWKLTDTDGDGVADKREEWFKGGTLTGCANDLHGPYAGPDGFIYWNKGAFAKQTHERAGQPTIVTRAAHTFRMRPDGSGLEFVMTGGMDNPVGLTFTPEGERFFTSTFVIQPQAGKRDGLVHAIYGGVYGKVNDVVDDHFQTGELMPITDHLGPAAPCGLMRYESGIMGMRDDLFVCQFNLHKVSRHALVNDGATFKTQDSDFVVAADTDFHPTDVLEDADGSILIVDTGGWYKLCCPTSQLAKPDVLGAIYRIRKSGMRAVEDGWGRKIDWQKQSAEQLAQLLAESRPMVRKHAMSLLAKQMPQGIPAIKKMLDPKSHKDGRLAAVWILTRSDSKEARGAARVAFNDPDAQVRIAAAHSASVWRDAGAKDGLVKMLTSGKPAEARVAAEALGRIGDESVVTSILKVASANIDRTLEHSLAYALIEIGKPQSFRVGMKAPHVEARKVTLIALSQIPNALRAEELAPLLVEKGELRQTAEWIAAKHPEWGGTFANVFRDRIAAKEFAVEDANALVPVLAKLSSSQDIQELIADLCGDSKRHAAIVGLRAMAESHLKKAPEIWANAVARAIGSGDADVKAQAISTARGLNAGKEARLLNGALSQAATDKGNPVALRVAAVRALPEGMTLPDELYMLLVENMQAGAAVNVRADAVTALTRSALTNLQWVQLAASVGRAGPLELMRLFDAFEKHANEAVGMNLVQSLKSSPVLASLPPDWASQKFAKYPESVRKAAEGLPRGSQGDALAQRQHLEEMLASLKGGDIRRGQAVFNNAKVACVSCHSMGYIGGKVGPDLTSIGQVRTETDLLEAILYPSASFVRSYEPLVVRTKDGETHTGILRGDNDQGIMLVSGPNAEERISRADIEEMRPGTVSIMPAGLESQLSKQELSDLLAFLKATKWGAN